MSLLDDQIEHLVVLMVENRSFNHLLGYLSSGH
jgi:phospholipase C